MTDADDIVTAAGVPKAEVIPPPHDPMAVARYLLDVGGLPVLRRWRGSWMQWTGPHWAEISPEELEAVLYHRLEHCVYLAKTIDGRTVEKQWAPTTHKLREVSHALAACLLIGDKVSPPAWLGAGTDPGLLIACRNVILRVADRSTAEHTPDLFNLSSVAFDYDPAAGQPGAWLGFLDSLWPDDPEPAATLQEWCGYVVSGRTDLHKICVMTGPPRSGKGTIVRVLTALVGGDQAKAAPTSASLTTNFGLASLIGKPLAVIGDARFGGDPKVVERLLTISGGDDIDVDRKYKPTWTGQLPSRFVILSNEPPNLEDASGTIAERFIVLPMTKSWLGCEDLTLASRLAEEYPAILNWALDGLVRLDGSGRFAPVTAAADSVQAVRDAASPVGAFVRDECIVGLGGQVVIDQLFQRWRGWCELNGVPPESKQQFCRKLLAVAPTVRRYRPRGEQRSLTGIALSKPWGVF